MASPSKPNEIILPAVKFPKELPLVFFRDIVMFPRLSAPFAIGEAKSQKAIEASAAPGRYVATLTVKNQSKDPGPDDLYRVGTVSKVVETMRQPDGSLRVFLEGVARIKVTEFVGKDPYFVVKFEELPEPQIVKNERIEALMYSAVSELKEAVGLGASVPFDALLVMFNLTDPWQLCDLIAVNIDFKGNERQEILEADSTEEKLTKTVEALGRQIKVLKMAKKIEQETGKELGKMEKEMMLREQLKAIEKELGGISGVSESEELKMKIEKAGMPETVKEAALKELARMAGMPSFSPEISYLRTYLDWLLEIPWAKKDQAAINVKKAQAILDEDHYGLEKVKERVLEFLSVQKLTGKQRGPILCFAGPPGTGKTSIGKSIARAARPEVRAHLAGRRPRRGRDPRLPPDLRRRAARPHHPGAVHGRHQEPGVHARRDRQARL